MLLPATTVEMLGLTHATAASSLRAPVGVSGLNRTQRRCVSVAKVLRCFCVSFSRAHGACGSNGGITRKDLRQVLKPSNAGCRVKQLVPVRRPTLVVTAAKKKKGRSGSGGYDDYGYDNGGMFDDYGRW